MENHKAVSYSPENYRCGVGTYCTVGGEGGKEGGGGGADRGLNNDLTSQVL